MRTTTESAAAKNIISNLIHYRKIATEHWDIFKDLLGFGKPGASKDKQTAWMNELNEKRKIVSHASSAISLSLEDLTQLQEYEITLTAKISGRASPSPELALQQAEA
jgi:hypothetical protein